MFLALSISLHMKHKVTILQYSYSFFEMPRKLTALTIANKLSSATCLSTTLLVVVGSRPNVVEGRNEACQMSKSKMRSKAIYLLVYVVTLLHNYPYISTVATVAKLCMPRQRHTLGHHMDSCNKTKRIYIR